MRRYCLETRRFTRWIGILWIGGWSMLACPVDGQDQEIYTDEIPARIAPVPDAPMRVRPEGDVLVDNGPLVNSPGTGAGGADESVVQTVSLGLSLFGLGQQIGDKRIADDFTISDPSWQLDSCTFFGYQSGSTTVSTINAVTLRIWDGDPSAGGVVIFGNTTTNRLISTSWSNIYRVSETTGGATNRPIFTAEASIGIQLGPGTYWLDWSMGGSPLSGPWAPPVTVTGQTITGNGLQSMNDGLTYAPALDPGPSTRQGFPFICRGTSSSPEPSADFSWTPNPPIAEDAAQFQNLSGGADLSFFWDFEGDGTIDSNAANPSFAFPDPGPYPVTLTAVNPYGSDSVTKIVDVAPAAAEPIITSVVRSLVGFFLEGTDAQNTFDVSVDWAGETPGQISYRIGDGAPQTAPADTDGASFSFELSELTPAQTATSVVLTAINAGGTEGGSWTEYVHVFPYPSWLSAALSDNASFDVTIGNGEVDYGIFWDFPETPIAEDCLLSCAASGCGGKCRQIPEWVPYLGGTFDLLETGSRVRAEVSSAGTGTLSLSGQTGFFGLAGGTGGVVGEGSGSGTFRLRPPDGLDLQSASLKLRLAGWIGKEVGIVDAIPALATISNLPRVRRFLEIAKLTGSVSPRLETTFSFQQDDLGELVFQQGAGTLGIDLKGVLSVKFSDHLRARAWVAGGGSLQLAVPQPHLREIEVHLEAGAKVTVDVIWQFDLEAAARFQCRWTALQGFSCGSAEGSPAPSSIRLLPIEIPYDEFGAYSEVRNRPLPKQDRPDVPISTTQTTVIANVFPGAAPALAELSSGRLLTWVHQDPADPVQQSTEIAWSYQAGAGPWSAPQWIADDTRAESAPVIGVDSAGRAVAVWTRIADPDFDTPITTTDELPLFYREMEIVGAVFDPATVSWSPITSLTSNTAWEGDLKLSSDGSGDLTLSWIENEDGLFTSTAASPATVRASSWDSASQTWNEPITVASGVVGLATHAAAASGNEVWIILPIDPDPSTTNDGLLTSYVRDAGGAWTGPTTFAAGGVENRFPALIYDASGEGRITWLRDGDLVHATLDDPTPAIVRAGSASMSFADQQLLIDDAGNLTVLRQEVTGEGAANLFARIFDSASGSWSEDRRLTAEEEVLHQDLSGFYGDDGVLRAAFVATQIERTSETIVIDGETVTLTNLPQTARSDLRVLEHSLIVDLATDDGSLTAEPGNPRIGETVDASVTVYNAGDFPVGTFDVEWWVGEPTADGVLVAFSTVEGPFAAGDQTTLSTSFAQPAAAGDLIAWIDPANAVAEATQANNRAIHSFDNEAPFAIVTASVTSGDFPLTVQFDASASFDPEGEAVEIGWTFADGGPDANGPIVSRTFESEGVYPVTVAVSDPQGRVGTAVVVITATTSLIFSDDFETGDVSRWTNVVP